MNAILREDSNTKPARTQEKKAREVTEHNLVKGQGF